MASINNGYDCELRLVGSLDADTRRTWNITIGVREVSRTKRQAEIVPGKQLLILLEACP